MAGCRHIMMEAWVQIPPYPHDDLTDAGSEEDLFLFVRERRIFTLKSLRDRDCKIFEKVMQEEILPEVVCIIAE